MADFQLRIDELEIVVTYTPGGFSPTSEDWWEYTENLMITFLERLKAAIDNDATIQGAYAPETLIQLNDDLTRLEANAKFQHHLIIIHGIRSEASQPWGSGRYNRPLQALITFYTRSDKGRQSNKEVNLVGDATAARPGVLEIAEDVKALFTNNYLESGGTRYLWNIELGEIEADDVTNEQYKGQVIKASFRVTGHKFEFYA